MTTKISPPADLDPTRLHTPAEVRQWKDACHAYNVAIADEAKRETAKEQRAIAEANRALTDEEYYEMAVKREAENKTRQAEREAESQAKQAEAEAYLESQPESVDILEQSEFTLLAKLAHRLAQGYEISDSTIKWWTPGLYHLELRKPVIGRRKGVQ